MTAIAGYFFVPPQCLGPSLFPSIVAEKEPQWSEDYYPRMKYQSGFNKQIYALEIHTHSPRPPAVLRALHFALCFAYLNSFYLLELTIALLPLLWLLY